MENGPALAAWFVILGAVGLTVFSTSSLEPALKLTAAGFCSAVLTMGVIGFLTECEVWEEAPVTTWAAALATIAGALVCVGAFIWFLTIHVHINFT